MKFPTFQGRLNAAVNAGIVTHYEEQDRGGGPRGVVRCHLTGEEVEVRVDPLSSPGEGSLRNDYNRAVAAVCEWLWRRAEERMEQNREWTRPLP